VGPNGSSDKGSNSVKKTAGEKEIEGEEGQINEAIGNKGGLEKSNCAKETNRVLNPDGKEALRGAGQDCTKLRVLRRIKKECHIKKQKGCLGKKKKRTRNMTIWS